MLDCNILQQVSELLENPPASNKYNAFISALVNAFSDCSERQLMKLLTVVKLVDQKATQLLRHIRLLTNNQVTNDVLMILWLQRLPRQVQLILSASQGVGLAKMADILDKIIEVSSNVRSTTPTPGPSATQISRPIPVTPTTWLSNRILPL